MAKELLPILIVLASVTGVYSQEPVDVKAGDIVALHCPWLIVPDHSDAKVVWTRYSPQDTTVISDMPPAKQTHMGVLLHGRSLVIFSASVNHQGNYSCSLGNADNQFWFRLTVYNQPSAEIEKRNRFSRVCYTQESCTLTCPDRNIPDVNTPNISTFPNIRWHKEGELMSNDGYFSSVEQEDQGVYTCTRSYLYHSQSYNKTFKVKLDVQTNQKAKLGKAMIVSPSNSHTLNVQLGARLAIDCKAVTSSDFDELFWLSDTSFVQLNDSLPVYYTYHVSEYESEQKHITATLIFKRVSHEDLLRRYTCKLDSVSGLPSFVTITLAPKAWPFSPFLALSVVGILVTAVAVVYVKFKIHITLFLRDSFHCHNSISDGKRYDAVLLFYESETGAGLDEDNRQWLESVLEVRFGYRLCLYDRNGTPGTAEAEAVLDCIEQSRTVVLVPAPPDCCLGSAVVDDIAAALVELRNRLVCIKTETTNVPASGSLPQALERLGKAKLVTWKGTSSKSHASCFFKQLRYYLSAPQHAPNVRLLPLTAAQYDIC